MSEHSIIPVNPGLDESWRLRLSKEFSSSFFRELIDFLAEEIKTGKEVFPPAEFIFEAFNRTPFGNVKVVILGQDPYHGKGQAHGLSFSVPQGEKQPPSLRNIFKELKEDLCFELPESGNLSSWADQGVLLLNATLTVRSGQPGSHQNKGWEFFTDSVIRILSQEKENLVFILWGRYARGKSILIDHTKHLVLEAAHPSPLSAYNGFFGCRHFSKANEFLKGKGLSPIKWCLP